MALLNAVYLQNHLVHFATGITPYKGWSGPQPDLSHLKCFGSQICINVPGSQHCKLDKHNFTRIFLGYTATNSNIIYLNSTSSIVKTSHHVVFDEAWYLQNIRPLATQLLYDLGLKDDDRLTAQPWDDDTMPAAVDPPSPTIVPWPPPIPKPTSIDTLWPATKWLPLSQSLRLPLPLQLTSPPMLLVAKAMQIHSPPQET